MLRTAQTNYKYMVSATSRLQFKSFSNTTFPKGGPVYYHALMSGLSDSKRAMRYGCKVLVINHLYILPFIFTFPPFYIQYALLPVFVVFILTSLILFRSNWNPN